VRETAVVLDIQNQLRLLQDLEERFASAIRQSTNRYSRAGVLVLSQESG